MFRALALVLPLAASLASPAAAWGPLGHRVSAEIATRNISGRTRAHVEQILGDRTLLEVSTEADEQRQNPDPFWQAAAPWHYITLPRGQAVAEIAHPATGDALTALEQFVATLRDPAASRAERARALGFVAHLVADTHLPVHAGDEVLGGAGGVEVRWFGEPQNLHWVWDEGLIGRKQLSATEYAGMLAGRTTGAERIAWWRPDPVAWMQESAGLRDQVYAAITVDGEPLNLSWQYVYDWTPAMELRLRQSGIRLAAYLDWVFAEVE